ncbi:MAG: hypothetical protein S4CHLAM45_07890 [Chlamydiales bacterium]|nr:hypothetical protein [Chlamydiales bacterium]MCH9620001.1 hypothetical protein [Chlamydiales bacterium]MCH9622895.1 hypothetical protein [Chlamydiales bacterium]
MIETEDLRKKEIFFLESERKTTEEGSGDLNGIKVEAASQDFVLPQERAERIEAVTGATLTFQTTITPSGEVDVKAAPFDISEGTQMPGYIKPEGVVTSLGPPPMKSFPNIHTPRKSISPRKESESPSVTKRALNGIHWGAQAFRPIEEFVVKGTKNMVKAGCRTRIGGHICRETVDLVDFVAQRASLPLQPGAALLAVAFKGRVSKLSVSCLEALGVSKADVSEGIHDTLTIAGIGFPLTSGVKGFGKGLVGAVEEIVLVGQREVLTSEVVDTVATVVKSEGNDWWARLPNKEIREPSSYGRGAEHAEKIRKGATEGVALLREEKRLLEEIVTPQIAQNSAEFAKLMPKMSLHEFKVPVGKKSSIEGSVLYHMEEGHITIVAARQLSSSTVIKRLGSKKLVNVPSGVKIKQFMECYVEVLEQMVKDLGGKEATVLYSKEAFPLLTQLKNQPTIFRFKGVSDYDALGRPGRFKRAQFTVGKNKKPAVLKKVDPTPPRKKPLTSHGKVLHEEAKLWEEALASAPESFSLPRKYPFNIQHFLTSAQSFSVRHTEGYSKLHYSGVGDNAGFIVVDCAKAPVQGGVKALQAHYEREIRKIVTDSKMLVDIGHLKRIYYASPPDVPLLSTFSQLQGELNILNVSKLPFDTAQFPKLYSVIEVSFKK